MPTEKEMLAALFAGKSVADQKALLERAGVGLHRAWAASEPNSRTKAALLAAAEREEQNARVLEEPASKARPRLRFIARHP